MTLIDAFRDLPDDEGKLRQELDIGGTAHRLLNDVAFKSAVQKVRDAIYGTFAASPPDTSGDEARRNARLKLDLLNDILTDLRNTEGTGKMAEQQLGFIEKMKKKLAR